jgi:hypothetical protein
VTERPQPVGHDDVHATHRVFGHKNIDRAHGETITNCLHDVATPERLAGDAPDHSNGREMLSSA